MVLVMINSGPLPRLDPQIAMTASWTDAASAVATQTTIPLRAYRVGPASADVELVDVDGNWQPRYELGRDGAVLVRPDGYVAWRSASPAEDPAALLTGALQQVLGTAH